MQHHLRDIEDSETIDCLSCKHFRSYADTYFDELEPSDLGTCPIQDIDDEMVGYGVICDKHEKF